MYSAMMDPELMRIAQEQMSRIPPEELARIQQQMMSNPELLRMASEGMNNMRTEDLKRAAEKMKHTRPEDMAEIGKKIANASPEEVAAMKAQADAQISYVISGAKMLKEQGNKLHSQGNYHEAAEKYLLAKNNLKELPSSAGQTLQLQCGLNLMSCYLKTGEYKECIIEGSEVLTIDLNNVKAYYRRGQAYKELGNLEAAVADLVRAHEISPEDETIAEVLRDLEEKVRKEGGNSTRKGVSIEEIVTEETPGSSNSDSSSKYPVSQTSEVTQNSSTETSSPDIVIDTRHSRNSRGNPATMGDSQYYNSTVGPDTAANVGMQGFSPEMIKTATQMIGTMKPEELQKMFQVAASLNQNQPNGTNLPPQMPEMSPEMVQMASSMINNMQPSELENMLKMASSMGINQNKPTRSVNRVSQRSDSCPSSSSAKSSLDENDGSVDDINDDGVSDNQRSREWPSSASASTADLQESMRNTMNDPAMRQMFSSMMKNMSPEMMANMSEQFGMKLSREDAARAQEAMSKLSPTDIDRMMRWANKAQQGIEIAKKTKSWLLGRQGLILAIVMLILAFLLHQLGFIGG